MAVTKAAIPPWTRNLSTTRKVRTFIMLLSLRQDIVSSAAFTILEKASNFVQYFCKPVPSISHTNIKHLGSDERMDSCGLKLQIM